MKFKSPPRTISSLLSACLSIHFLSFKKNIFLSLGLFGAYTFIRQICFSSILILVKIILPSSLL